MPWSSTPSLMLGTAYAASSTNVTLAIADFSELTSGEANATTGDSRKILFALLEGVYNRYRALADTDESNKMKVNRSRNLNADDTITSTYTFTFTLSATGLDVVTPD
jgi:hypothetical protein